MPPARSTVHPSATSGTGRNRGGGGAGPRRTRNPSPPQSSLPPTGEHSQRLRSTQSHRVMRPAGSQFSPEPQQPTVPLPAALRERRHSTGSYFTVSDTRRISARNAFSPAAPRSSSAPSRPSSPQGPATRAVASLRCASHADRERHLFMVEQRVLEDERRKEQLAAWIERQTSTANVLSSDSDRLREMRFLFLEAVEYHRRNGSDMLMRNLTAAFDRRQDERSEDGVALLDAAPVVGSEASLIRTVLSDLSTLQESHGAQVAMSALVSLNIWALPPAEERKKKADSPSSSSSPDGCGSTAPPTPTVPVMAPLPPSEATVAADELPVQDMSHTLGQAPHSPIISNQSSPIMSQAPGYENHNELSAPHSPPHDQQHLEKVPVMEDSFHHEVKQVSSFHSSHSGSPAGFNAEYLIPPPDASI